MLPGALQGTGAPFDCREPLVFVVPAGALFGAPFSHVCAGVALLFYTCFCREDVYNFETNSV